MAASIIDGTVEEAVPGRSRGGTTVFKSIRFLLDDGSSRTLTKMVVKQAVADELTPGAKRRFYLFNAFDPRGVHGVRTPVGREVFELPDSNQKLFLVMGGINLAWVAFMIFTEDRVPMLGVALFILAVVGWYFRGKGAKEATAQFKGGAGYSPTGAAPLTQPL